MFLDGMTIRNIAKELTERGIKTPGGKDVWSVSTIRSILSNEKYKGDALLQKTYTLDYLSKTVKKNNGEVKQYYVTNSHEAKAPNAAPTETARNITPPIICLTIIFIYPPTSYSNYNKSNC